MLRIRDWLVLALMFGFAAPSASFGAQDKAKGDDKAKAAEKAAEKPAEKAAEKPADKPIAEGDKVELKWKFEKDKKIYQEMVTKTSQFMKVMGMEVNQTQEQTFYFSW